LCFLWWIVFGALLGWLGHWALSRFFRRAEPQIVEKTVDRVVDNPLHLTRIKTLEQELQGVPALRSRIAELERRAPMIIDNIIEKPVEKIVDRVVDNPAHLSRIRQLEGDLAIIPQLRSKIAELEARPPKVVEKIIDRPVEKIVEKPVEKIVDRVVDNPAHLSRIRSLETELGVLPGLRQKIAELEARPPKIVEKPVEKPVDRLVDNPVHLARVRMLEKEVAQIPALRAKIAELEARPPRIVEKLVESPPAYERPVERIIERVVTDTRAGDDQNRRLRELERRFESIEAALLRRASAPDPPTVEAGEPPPPPLPLTIAEIDIAAARAEGFAMRSTEDFEVLTGLAPNAAQALKRAGATTFAHIAGMTDAEIAEVLRVNGVEADDDATASWPEQAELAARNRWRALKALQRSLASGDR
jgi:predicted flap endonuclease-1-like 5' DNA nuclease